MPSDGNTPATSDNATQKQVAVGAFMLEIEDKNGGVVSVAPRAWGRPYSKRNVPVDQRPRPFLALLDREDGIATLQASIQVSRHVSLFGPSGIGKTSVLRSLAHLPETDRFPDGVVYLSLSEAGLEDVLQLLFDAFHESRENFKPTVAEIRAALREIKALILLDNLNLTREESNELLAAAPECTFVLSSLERILWGKGELIDLVGLPLEESFDLFVLELNRSLDDREQVDVREMCQLLAGHPLRVVQTASLVREHRVPIGELKAGLQSRPPDEVVMGSVLDSATDSQKALIAILAAAGGAEVPVKLLEDFSASAELKNDLKKLVSLGLVQAHSSKFTLAGALSATVGQFMDLASWESRWIKFLVGWLAKRPAQQWLEGSTDLLVKMIHKSEQKNRWQDVLRIGQEVETSLIQARRWQAWQEVLRRMLKAARSLGDRKTEAWALHQLGTRAACLGPDAEARGFLTQALQIREAIGDRAGMAATRNNLRVLFNIPLPVDGQPAGTRRYLQWTAIGAGILLVVSVAVLGLFQLFSNRFTLPPVAGPTGTSPVLLTPENPTQGFIPPALTSTPAGTLTPTILADFVSLADGAVWESSETFDPVDNVFGECDLTFGAPPVEPCGFARWENTALEDNIVRENVLVVEPYHANGAQIQATYDLTDLVLRKGDRLVTAVGFVKAAETLGVAFSVLFTTGEPGTSPVVLYATRDRNDGRLVENTMMMPDELAGQRGYFILHVVATPNTNANWASWAVVRLERP